MWAGVIKVLLEWFSGFLKAEIKQDIKASDAETEPEIRNRMRSSFRRRLRDDESGVRKD